MEKEFAIIIVAIFTTFLALQTVLGASGSFSASATVGNQAPTIAVDSGQSITGDAGQEGKSLLVFFNATDQNGNSDLNDSSAQVILSTAGESPKTSSGCVVGLTIDSDSKRYNCTISLDYFDKPGGWIINATIQDNQANSTENSTINLTVGDLDAVAVVLSSISFSGSPGTNDVASTTEPQRLNNTGNQDYSSINITGFEFVDGSNKIGADNVTFNITDSNGPGQVLVNNTELAISGASLSRGQGNNQSIYFWLDIPAGQAPGTYSASSNWQLEAII